MAERASYDKAIIVSVFVRIARAQANPTDFLLALLTGNFTVVTNGDATVLTSSTTGGSSASFVLPPGMSRFDVMEIAELALRILETGIDCPPKVEPTTGAMTPPEIRQVPLSQRVISYGQFGNIRR